VKVFLDTNVVVSAVATRGLCADLMQVILAEHELVLGETVLEETRRVLGRKMRVPTDVIDDLDTYLRGQAAVVEAEGQPVKSLDAADARVLAEAVAAGADALVTGDGDLLQLSSPPLLVVSPRGLWDLLRRAT